MQHNLYVIKRIAYQWVADRTGAGRYRPSVEAQAGGAVGLGLCIRGTGFRIHAYDSRAEAGCLHQNRGDFARVVVGALIDLGDSRVYLADAGQGEVALAAGGLVGCAAADELAVRR